MRLLLRVLAALTAATALRLLPPVAAQTAAGETVALPLFVLTAPRVANPVPVGTFAMPVSGLRFEPLVDVQARNFAEGQADVAVRGGIFEGTGFRVGAGTLLDPQTGHYAAEIPIAPAMLAPVRVLTGVEAALAGLNATTATLAYDWRPVAEGGEVAVAFGENRARRVAIREGRVLADTIGDGRLAADVAVARSTSDGPVAGGDHAFSRVSARLQWIRGAAQTDVFVGRQAKFFGWPNLYTPFGWLETENLHTTLVGVNHRVGDPAGDGWEASASWRRHTDDYEADRTRPGVFNPYVHETRVGTAAAAFRRTLGSGWTLRARTEAAADEIESTSLTFGRFHSRTLLKAGAAVGRERRIGSGEGEATVGATWADDNRGPGRLSPLAELAWRTPVDGGDWRVYAQVAGDSQVASYTALNSNPASGLFRGNPDLARAHSTNWEVGARTGGRGFEAAAAFFLRRDRGLVDWTFRKGVTARTANAVDLDTRGFEAVITRRWRRGRATLGYTRLEKVADYRGGGVDASFYALNFPRHRATASLVWQPVAAIEVRWDHEYREQEPNFLRRSGPRAILSSAGICWYVPGAPGLELSLVVDNLWNSGFEEVPAVPAAPRQYSAGLAYRW